MSMNDKTQYNDIPPKRKKRKSSAGYIVAIVLLSLITISSLLVAYQSVKLYKDSLVTETEEEKKISAFQKI